MTIHGRSGVGFVGVGKLGRPVAERLLRAEHDLVVFDTDDTAISTFRGTAATVATSLAELVSKSEIVCLCLPGPTEMERVVLGPGGIASVVTPGTLVVDHTTNSPAVIREVGRQLGERDAALVDAPVSGGVEGAATGELTTLIGGEVEHVDRVHPLLSAFSTSVVHVGPLGAGTVAKLMNNLAAFSLDQVIGECLTIGAKAGIDPDRLLEALRQSAIGKGGNLQVRIPDTFMKGDFKARFTLAGAHKDVRLALDLADEVGVPSRIARLVFGDMEAALSNGLADLDASIVMTLQEERAGVNISSRSQTT